MFVHVWRIYGNVVDSINIALIEIRKNQADKSLKPPLIFVLGNRSAQAQFFSSQHGIELLQRWILARCNYLKSK
jgi:hypothetical protein